MKNEMDYEESEFLDVMKKSNPSTSYQTSNIQLHK